MVASHDQEWGVPVHDDRQLFEMLNLEGAQRQGRWQWRVMADPEGGSILPGDELINESLACCREAGEAILWSAHNRCQCQLYNRGG